ncbi:CPBP family glutamic-type intramembrane protease [Frigoriglobus tundricola]|uniref:CAAX prenyl protease 2/Lysostaphin resistance protein A-like domain-containing protein n=1 Tax=Frigoriglobus tundricola TaxID=2774151 RepID=A0A6M5YJF7_9BACT|nr:CPBP family glutamic-type intramembrane protease [Frigoriglobus tundricola]QJW94219.1 hypothetical protein FTUN_1739 [Frigoriglobus tundricola]
MPADLWTEAGHMMESGLLVAMGAVPLGLLAWAARPDGEPLLPRWTPWRVPWSGFEVVTAFLVVSFVLPAAALEVLTQSAFYGTIYGADFPPPGAKDVSPDRAKDASIVRMLWANLVALPFTLGLIWAAARTLYPTWKPKPVASTAGRVKLAVVAWLVLAPTVLVFNAVVNAVALMFDVTPDAHALTKFAGHPALDQVLFALEACVAAPVREEIVFRGVLLSWCVGRMKLPGAGVTRVTGTRPWFVMLTAVAFAAVLSDWRPAPVAFAGSLAVGLAVVGRYARTGARRIRAVYATAALFAVVHTSVWPSPVPLFLLGLGLGWLAVRTKGVLVPVLVHGLFNAVSAVFVLRGGG